MIKLLEVKEPGDNKWYEWFKPFPDGFKLWSIICDVCGKHKDVKRMYYHYGFGDLGLVHKLTLRSYGFEVVDYGKFNRRSIIICMDHKDAEIEKKVNELI